MIESINRLTPVYIEFLKKIVSIETPSEDKARLDKLVDYIDGFLKERGFQTERIPFERSGDFLRVRKGSGSKKPVMFMAHMDTVHPVGNFGEKILWEEGSFLCGPGATDCKGGLATSLLVMEALSEDKSFDRSTVMLLTADEEISGRLSGERGFDLMRETAKESCALFNGEPGTPDGITVSRKGILRLKVEVKGRAAHAGNAYFKGASAIREAAHQIINVEGESREDGATFNCGLISGGKAANAVPDYCTFTVDIRGVTDKQLHDAHEKVLSHTKATTVPDTECTVSVLSRRPPMEDVPANRELLAVINEAARDMGVPEFKPIKRGGGSDAAYTVQVGTPTVCSCGPVGTFEHSTKERVDLSTFEPRAELIYRAAKKL
ncbi:MAG: M20/M25/M40 family metallo-hydrolase [Clostridia bacterium]|nr:M20/M25/M40 family metallo-hydrolase [Clostridia bacterium]